MNHSGEPSPHIAIKKKQAVAQMVLAASLWGMGFTATVWALRDMGPLWLNVLRFSLACAVGLLVVVLVPHYRRELTLENIKLSFLPGLFLAGTLLFQTWGQKYTTATKSSFITCLYVLFVPVLDRLVLKRDLPRSHGLFVLLALVGTAFICELHAGEWNFGDLLTFICALVASLQIFWLGVIAKKIQSAFVFNVLQSLWCLLIPLALAPLLEPMPQIGGLAGMTVVGLCLLAFGSTIAAFGLQVAAQKELSPSVASLLCLLESPFATLFAIYFLSEALSGGQWLGAAMIMAAVTGATILDLRREAQVRRATR